MVPDVRSSASEVDFDLLTPDGVMQALALVRASSIDPAAKREVRDLIFAYTSSGGDPALRTLIESELAALGPVATAEVDAQAESMGAREAAPASDHAAVGTGEPDNTSQGEVVVPPRATQAGFRGSRPTPQFRPVTPIVPAPVVTPEPVIVATPEVVPAVVAAVPQMQPTKDPEPVPMVPKSIVDEKLAPVAPPSEPSVEYKAPYREDSSADAARDRINAIKQMINTKVGNPVNLVDMDNAIGRSYMTALLEAMKAVSGGGGDVGVAMSRLEAVVLDVEKLFATHPVAVTSPVQTPSPVPTVAQSAPVIAPVDVPSEPRIEAVIPHKADPIPAPVTPSVPTPTSAPVTAPAPVAPAAPVAQAAPRSQVPVVSADTKVISPMAIASSRFKNVLPVTDREPLKTPADLPTAAEVKARSGITDPLEDPDVDLGLEQLLGEWSLFKKSGMFGTGPKGRQHPLFIKLASIPMPLILSGRFEGSTSEIRQSITDYMNGWRYEQGIIYEQDETFEHYLRRVIRHIIDSQTRRRGA